MKKLLVLMLILGIASLATAALQISVVNPDGTHNPDPVDTEINVPYPSGILILDIHGDVPAGSAINWMMVVEQGAGTVNGGEAVQGSVTGSHLHSYITYYFLPSLELDPYLSATAGWVGDIPALSGVLVDFIEFHCDGPGDVLVTLYGSDNASQWYLGDSLIIHQVPEPATMALLGLGALLLRRRK